MLARYSVALAALVLIFAGAIQAQEKDREYTIEGSVKSIDAKKMEVTILRINGKETTVKFDDMTEIYLDGKKSKFDKIKEKHEVRCSYWLDKKVATHLAIFVEIDRTN